MAEVFPLLEVEVGVGEESGVSFNITEKVLEEMWVVGENRSVTVRLGGREEVEEIEIQEQSEETQLKKESRFISFPDRIPIPPLPSLDYFIEDGFNDVNELEETNDIVDYVDVKDTGLNWTKIDDGLNQESFLEEDFAQEEETSKQENDNVMFEEEIGVLEDILGLTEDNENELDSELADEIGDQTEEEEPMEVNVTEEEKEDENSMYFPVSDPASRNDGLEDTMLDSSKEDNSRSIGGDDQEGASDLGIISLCDSLINSDAQDGCRKVWDAILSDALGNDDKSGNKKDDKKISNKDDASDNEIGDNEKEGIREGNVIEEEDEEQKVYFPVSDLPSLNDDLEESLIKTSEEKSSRRIEEADQDGYKMVWDVVLNNALGDYGSVNTEAEQNKEKNTNIDAILEEDEEETKSKEVLEESVMQEGRTYFPTPSLPSNQYEEPELALVFPMNQPAPELEDLPAPRLEDLPVVGVRARALPVTKVLTSGGVWL